VKNINTQIAEKMLNHTVDVTRISADTRLRVIGYLKELEQEIVKMLSKERLTERAKKRFLNLKVQVKDAIARTYASIHKTHKQSLKDIAQLEFEFLRKTIKAKVGVDIFNIALSTERINRLVSDTLIQGAKSAEWWSHQDKEFYRRFLNEIRMGMSLGESIDDMVRRIRGKSTRRKISGYVTGKNGKTVLRRFPEYIGGITNISTRHAETLVRTSAISVSNQARLDSYEANSDVVKGVQWLATLDNKTTLICMNLDGKVWDMNYQPVGHSYPFPGPTAHWNCRSTQNAVLKSNKELGLPEIPGHDGKPSDRLNYQKWFSEQSEARQREILGDTKFEMYKNDGLSLSQMVDQRANPLTIKELTAKVNAN